MLLVLTAAYDFNEANTAVKRSALSIQSIAAPDEEEEGLHIVLVQRREQERERERAIEVG